MISISFGQGLIKCQGVVCKTGLAAYFKTRMALLVHVTAGQSQQHKKFESVLTFLNGFHLFRGLL